MAAPELLAVNGYPVPLGGQLVGEDDDDQYFDLVDTPIAVTTVINIRGARGGRGKR